MKALVDTNLLIWMGEEPRRLSRRATAILGDPGRELLFSALSVAEVAIKYALGRPDFRIEPELFRQALLREEFGELPLTGVHASRLADLPPVHRDPFDRLMIAQALAEGVPFVTADPVLSGYPGQVIVV